MKSKKITAKKNDKIVPLRLDYVEPTTGIHVVEDITCVMMSEDDYELVVTPVRGGARLQVIEKKKKGKTKK